MTGNELALLDFIQNTLRSGFMDQLMAIITHMGDLGAIWFALAAAFLLRGDRRKVGIAIIIGMAIAFIIGSLILKPLVARPRPCDVDLAVQLLVARPLDYSFPSGHTAAAFAATAVLFLARSKIRIPALILAILIAFSRLYLFVHYPSDVLAGALLGVLCGWAAWILCGTVLNRKALNGREGSASRHPEAFAVSRGLHGDVSEVEKGAEDTGKEER